MPADGSQYLVTEQRSSTARGDTSASVHSQTVTYNAVTDTVVTNRTHDKVTTQRQEQVGSNGDSSEATVKVPRSIQLTFEVDFLGTTIMGC